MSARRSMENAHGCGAYASSNRLSGMTLQAEPAISSLRMAGPFNLRTRFMHKAAAIDERSQSLDEASVDQQPIEAARLGTVGAAVEQPAATLENPFLFREGRVEWQT